MTTTPDPVVATTKPNKTFMGRDGQTTRLYDLVNMMMEGNECTEGVRLRALAERTYHL